MRSRRQHNPWPAVADFMTMMAVAACAWALSEREAALSQVTSLEGRLAAVVDVAASSREQLLICVEESAQLLAQQGELQGSVTELQNERARNADMFRAIQLSEEIIERLQGSLRVDATSWGRDQSLRFGEDLIKFDTNQSVVKWQPGGQALMRQFCETLSSLLSQPFSEDSSDAAGQYITVLVEGHTDGRVCRGRGDDCNWQLSADRALAVRREMLNADVCPGVATWRLLPIGMGASQRIVTDERTEDDFARNRRIELRLVPDYSRIIRAAGDVR